MLETDFSSALAMIGAKPSINMSAKGCTHDFCAALCNRRRKEKGTSTIDKRCELPIKKGDDLFNNLKGREMN